MFHRSSHGIISKSTHPSVIEMPNRAHVALSATVLPTLPLSQPFRPTVMGTPGVVACTASSYRLLSVIARLHFPGLNGLENELDSSPVVYCSVLFHPRGVLLGFRCPKFSGSCKVWALSRRWNPYIMRHSVFQFLLVKGELLEQILCFNLLQFQIILFL
jgi:hypothetical protein